MPEPLLTTGTQTALFTVDPYKMDTTLSRSLGVSADRAIEEAPFRSIFQSSRISAAAEQTGGITGIKGEVQLEALGRMRGGLFTMPVSEREAWESIRNEIDESASAGLWLTRDDADRMSAEYGFTSDDLGVSRYGMNNAVFQMILKAKKDERIANAALSNAQAGIIASPLRFGVSLAASMTDPINLGTSFIPIFGQARYAAPIGRGIRGARDALARGLFQVEEAATTLGRLSQRAVLGGTEAFIGAAGIEPFVLEGMTRQQLDYDISDAFSNVLFGTILGGGLHMGLGAISDAITRKMSPDATKPQGRQARALEAYQPETRHAALQSSIGQTESGYNTNANLVLAADDAGIPDASLDFNTAKFDAEDQVDQLTAQFESLEGRIASGIAEGKSASGIPKIVGEESILTATDDLGGIRGKSQYKRGKSPVEYDDMPTKPGIHRKAYRSKGGLNPDEMAMKLRERGFGDGTVATMWRMIAEDQEARAAIKADVESARGELSELKSKERGLVDVMATRRRMQVDGESAATTIGRELRTVENRRGYDANASQMGDEINTKPDQPVLTDVEQEISELQDSLQFWDLEPDAVDAALRDVEADIKTADRTAKAFEQAMVCGMHRGS